MKRARVRGDRLGCERLSADVDVPRVARHRDPRGLPRGEHPGRGGRDRGRQRDQPRQRGGGGRARAQVAVRLAAGGAQGALPARASATWWSAARTARRPPASMLAWMFESAGRKPGFMIGGLPRNFGCGARFTDSGINVLEGDEYDTAFFDKRSKFLHYLPEVVVVNNIEFDHADIYASVDEIKLSFRRLLNIVPRNGLALVNGDDPNCREVAAGAPCPVRTRRVRGRIANCGSARWTTTPTALVCVWTASATGSPMAGEFNVRNAAMAAAAAAFAGLDAGRDPGGAGVVRGGGAPAGTARRGGRGQGGRRLRASPDGDPAGGGGLAAALSTGRACGSCSSRGRTPRGARCSNSELAEALAGGRHRGGGRRAGPGKGGRRQTGSTRGGWPRTWRPAAAMAPSSTRCRKSSTTWRRAALPGDVVAVLSNGGFGGIHGKLLDRLAGR